ncbi:putative AP-2 adaptor complex subunit sigma [Aureobasidium pullulans]|uniref:AP-2 complex subunit sigma n=1 Tax=Aureobasidium pullulans TaxID=5580 RepID=A0A4S8YZL1_AURPU|nr:putative AP-2 adaptor complex subunit sigma [Aureobasidium pullulans]
MVLSFILIQNRQGKTRLAKWYAPYSDEEKVKLKGEIHRLVAPRDQKHQSNFVEFRGSSKIVYRRYAGLFFCACVDANDNELAYLEAIHFFVEVLDQFFGNVCELDLVFNFYKVSGTSKMRGRKVVEGVEEREEGTRKRYRWIGSRDKGSGRMKRQSEAKC